MTSLNCIGWVHLGNSTVAGETVGIRFAARLRAIRFVVVVGRNHLIVDVPEALQLGTWAAKPSPNP